MTIRPAIIGCVFVLVVITARPVDAQRQTTRSVDAIDAWVKAVNAHVPGRPDPSVGAIIAMTYDARRNLNTAYPLFIRILSEREVVTTRTEFDRAVTRLARTVRLTTGAGTFLKRAAVLHSDAVVLARRFPPEPDDAPRPSSTETIAGVRSGIRRERVPPLLTNDRVTLTRDGEIFGDAPADWNLPFARSLLDDMLRQYILPAAECARDSACPNADLTPAPIDTARVMVPTAPVSSADREFVGEWYHAVAAYLFAAGMNGDATAHLQQAARVLPDDARLLFDRGSYAETFGLPIYQVVQDAASRKANIIARIPAEETTNAEAERLYRRALEVDSGYLEARVRLARLLEHRGQHDEAAAQITRALEAQPSGVAGFYALIVGGRVEAARRRYVEALERYHAASLLYPGAQSALLGASHAALMLADLPRTLESIEQLALDGTVDADPWLDYQLGAGRDVNTLMARLWAHVSR